MPAGNSLVAGYRSLKTVADPPTRLSLFLPGLLSLPLNADPADLLRGLTLSALERLLARADGAPRQAAPGGLPRSLFELFGVPVDPGGEPPAAPVTHALDSGEHGPGRWYLRADPVHLRADVNQVILFEPGVLSLEAGEAEELVGELAPVLGEEGFRLEAPHPSRWYLGGDEPLRIQCRSLYEVIGGDVSKSLPQGDDAARAAAFLTTVQMTLHASAVNARREARGSPAVNSLWLWGGGIAPPSAPRRWTRVYSTDPLAQALARRAGGEVRETPGSAEEWLEAAAPGENLVVWDGLWQPLRYRDVEAWREALDALERDWLAPVLEAIAARRLENVTLQDEAGNRYTLNRPALRRWWRRPRAVSTWMGAKGGEAQS